MSNCTVDGVGDGDIDVGTINRVNRLVYSKEYFHLVF